jgi:hypothetical protein
MGSSSYLFGFELTVGVRQAAQSHNARHASLFVEQTALKTWS